MSPGIATYDLRARFDWKIVPASYFDNKESKNKLKFNKLYLSFKLLIIIRRRKINKFLVFK